MYFLLLLLIPWPASALVLLVAVSVMRHSMVPCRIDNSKQTSQALGHFFHLAIAIAMNFHLCHMFANRRLGYKRSRAAVPVPNSHSSGSSHETLGETRRLKDRASSAMPSHANAVATAAPLSLTMLCVRVHDLRARPLPLRLMAAVAAVASPPLHFRRRLSGSMQVVWS